MSIKVKRIGYVWMALMCLSILISGIKIQAASKDKTAPKITESINVSEYTNGNVKITIKVSDKSSISSVKWAAGAKKISYFKEDGKELNLNAKNKASVTVKKNGTYTFYAKDRAGNAVKKKVVINCIDKEAPVVELKLNKDTYTNKDLSIKVTCADDLSGIAVAKYLQGEAGASDIKSSGTVINISDVGTGKFKVSQNDTYTVLIIDKAGNETISSITVSNIDKIAPTLSATYSVMNQKATIELSMQDNESGIKSAKYIKGSYGTDSEKWDSTANTIDNLEYFRVSASGKYSIMVEDNAGNRAVTEITVEMEFRAAWISYLEFLKSKDYTEAQFKSYVDEMFDNCVSMNMNAVVVQVRPSSDAMYSSSYFPWSYYASGTQGKALSYDPLEYMVEAAHKRGLEFHAWVNPYRVTMSGTSISKLSEDNPARLWREDDATKRNVLSYGSKLYYNPAVKDVQNLIVNGVKEIVKNYDVDGIHFDDYFYPNLGSNYKSNFDATEYKAYVSDCETVGTTAKSIVAWRRGNVNTLVKKTYSAIKAINPDCVFGISPAGNINNLLSSSSYYVDIKNWLSSSEYVDYICPQIYWTFDHKTAPYKTVLKNWIDLKTSDTVNLYVGLAVYRAGSSESAATSYGDISWSQANNILKRQIIYGRNTGMVDGYMFFRYENMIGEQAKKEMKNVISILN